MNEGSSEGIAGAEALAESSIVESSIVDRHVNDRREFGWRTITFGYLRSRRLHNRRADDQHIAFLDWHHPWLFFLSVGIMLLSCVDAVLTLQLLNHGMIEANPLMNAILELGTGWFAASKMALTAVGILILVFLAKARFMDRVPAGLFLTVFFAGYACLVCYQTVSLLQLS